jgi:serine/threonine-protein phosphatase 2B regulatory subunit
MGINHSLQNEDVSGNWISFSKQEISILYSNFLDLDTDGDGLIGKDEFFDVPELQDNPIVQRLIAVFDKNRDEKVSLYEFIVGLNMLNSSSNLLFLNNF